MCNIPLEQVLVMQPTSGKSRWSAKIYSASQAEQECDRDNVQWRAKGEQYGKCER